MKQLTIVLTILLTAIASPRASWGAGMNYCIDESTDFTGNGCANADLNNVTSILENRLESDGWSGTRWSNQNAWPEDFIEQNSGGIDHVAGDSQTLSVYAGHGNRALIQFGYQRNGRCIVSFPPWSRRGWSSLSPSVIAQTKKFTQLVVAEFSAFRLSMLKPNRLILRPRAATSQILPIDS